LPFNQKLLKFISDNIEPLQGSMIITFVFPPVTPEVIQIKVLRTFSLLKPWKGLI